MERTSRKVPNGTYTMEVTSWNLHHGGYLTEHTQCKLPMERAPWKVLHRAFTIKVTS